MRTLSLTTAILAAAMTLSACDTLDRTLDRNRTGQVSASGPTVSYRVTGQDLSEVQRRADDYCERFNMNPRLVQTTRQAGGDTVAVYECRR